MIDEAKKKILDENLQELEGMFYNALKRFAENTEGFVGKIPEDSINGLSMKFRQTTHYYIMAKIGIKKMMEERDNG